MNPSSVVIFTNHHRKSWFFKEITQRLWDDGFRKIVVQTTGTGEMSGFQGCASRVFGEGHLSYNDAMECSGKTQKNLRGRRRYRCGPGFLARTLKRCLHGKLEPAK